MRCDSENCVIFHEILMILQHAIHHTVLFSLSALVLLMKGLIVGFLFRKFLSDYARYSGSRILTLFIGLMTNKRDRPFYPIKDNYFHVQ